MTAFLSEAPSIGLAKLASLVILSSSLAILGVVIMLRFLSDRREQHEKIFEEQWKSLFAMTIISDQLPRDIPVISSGYAMLFFRLWTHYHESLRGEAKERLRQILFGTGGNRIALKWLHGFSIRKKLMAVVVLGYLKEKSTSHYMQLLARKKNPLLSLVAARALLQIDPEIGLPFLMSFIVNRSDWSAEFIKNILKEIPGGLLVQTLGPAIERASDAHLPRLIGYLELCPYETGAPIVRTLIQQKSDTDVVIACLDYFQDPRDIIHVMRYVNHPAWRVRRLVAKVLGQFGTAGELDTLKSLLGDPEWQVRYQAAQSLAALPFVDKNQLSRMQEDDAGRQVGDILTQVLAEEAIRS